MVHLRKQKLKSGKESLFLDYVRQGKRQKEYLKLVLIKGDRKGNADKLKLAEQVRAQREIDLASHEHGVFSPTRKQEDFKEYWFEYAQSIDRKDKRVFLAAYHRFTNFHKGELRFMDVSEDLLLKFKRHLETEMNGETPFNYFKTVKRLLSDIVKRGYLKSSPAANIKNPSRITLDLRKNVLFPDEIQKLITASCGNSEVKRAFLFATQTGLRLCDVKSLKWGSVRQDPDYLEIIQAKTERKNVVPLNKNAIALLGKRGKPSALVFDLSISGTAISKNLKSWMEKAGIEKHITFHCARHSFITNILSSTGNLKLAATLAGHTTTKHTERYTHIVDSMRKAATDSLTVFENLN